MGTTFETICAQCGAVMKARDKGRGQTAYFCSKDCQHAHRRQGIEKPCIICGALTYRKPKEDHEHRYCSVECMHKDVSRILAERAPRREQRANWKGGVTYRGGYRFILRPDHPNATKHGYIAEHRFVMSEKIGRPLKAGEIVHHIDEDKLNNDPSNLMIVRVVDHSRAHRFAKVAGHAGWDAHPDGCVVCGTKDRPYQGKGKCSRCYARLKARERAARRKEAAAL